MEAHQTEAFVQELVGESQAASEEGLAALETWQEDEPDDTSNGVESQAVNAGPGVDYQEEENEHLMQASPDSKHSLDC